MNTNFENVSSDLSKDDRFCELPFVSGSPFMRFYAGVPLITKRGIPIGSLFIVDSRVRSDLSKQDIHFMGTMASTVMRHLEMVREVDERRRAMKMSRGLASFVEGRAELVEAEVEVEETEGSKVAGHFETDSGIARSKSKFWLSAGIDDIQPIITQQYRARKRKNTRMHLRRQKKRYSKLIAARRVKPHVLD